MSTPLTLSGRRMRGLARTEAKLFWRTPALLFWIIGFPILGLLVVGLIPGSRNPANGFNGISVFSAYLPIIIAFTMVMSGLNFLPVSLVTYRERGILRRLSTTPASPPELLGAQVVVTIAVQVVVGAVVIAVSTIAFGIQLRLPLGFLLAFVLLAIAANAMGMFLAAVCRTAKAANASGMLMFFVMMFFSGLWIPRPAMPSILRHISDFTPMGAGVQALSDAAAGQWPQLLHLAVMAGYAVICGIGAARLFRWE